MTDPFRYLNNPGRREDDDILDDVKGFGLSALQYLGETLDKPGRAIRGALGGNFREVANLLPFTDMVGLTDPRAQTTGRDLLEQYGFLEKNRKGLDAGDVAGFGAEVLLDPLTYLTLGLSTLGKSGKVAKAIGKLPKRIVHPKTGKLIQGARESRSSMTLNDVLRGASGDVLEDARKAAIGQKTTLGELLTSGEKLGGGARTRIPFTDIGHTFSGPLAQRIGGVMDTAGAATRFSAPGRLGAALFHAPTGGSAGGSGALTTAGQVVAEKAYDTRRVSEAAAKQKQLEVFKALDDAGFTGFEQQKQFAEELMEMQADLSIDPEDVTKFIAENGDQVGKFRRVLMQMVEGVTDAPNAVVQGVVDTMTGATSTAWKKVKEVGFADSDLDFMVKHFPRQSALHAGEEGVKGSARAVTMSSEFLKMRNRAFDLPGGGVQLEDLTHDPRFTRGTSKTPNEVKITDPEEASDLLWREGFEYTEESLDRYKELRKLDEFDESQASEWAALSIQREASDGLTDYLSKLDPGFAQSNRAFWQHPILPFGKYLARMEQIAGNGRAVQELYARTANVAGDGVSLRDALTQTGLKGDGAIDYAFSQIDDIGDAAVREQIDTIRILRQSADPDPAIRAAHLAEAEGMLKDIRIPQEYLKDAKRLTEFMRSTDDLRPVLDWIRKFTNTFKANVTTIFPAFHFRNMETLGLQHVIAGASDPRYGGAKQWWQPLKDSMDLFNGKEVRGANTIPGWEHLTDAEATTKLAEEIAAWMPPQSGQFSEILESLGVGSGLGGRGGGRLEDLLNSIPGRVPQSSVGQIAKEFIPRSLSDTNIFKVKGGFGGGETDVSSFVTAGRKLGDKAENLGRTASYIGFRRQGMLPDVAAVHSKAAHVDYGQLSQFEKNAMRLVVPFYSFQRHMLPYQLKQLVEKPGGLVRNTIRTAESLRDEGFVPPQLSQGLAIPVPEFLGGGEQPDGSQRFLTGLETPIESVLRQFRMGPNVQSTFSDTGKALAAMSNPLIKGPLELLTGQSFFQQGRPLKDLDPVVGRTVSNIAGGLGFEGVTERDFTHPLLEQLVSNSPISRIASQARTATDPRKGLLAKAVQLGTAFKFTDVNIVDSRQRAEINHLEDLLLSMPGVGNFNIFYENNPELMPLNPEQRAVLEQLQRARKR